MNYKQKLESQYEFSTGKKNHEIIHIKNKHDHPFRIRTDSAHNLVLDQLYKPKTYLRGKWIKVTKGETKEMLYLTIIKKHNRALEYMTTWQKIEI